MYNSRETVAIICKFLKMTTAVAQIEKALSTPVIVKPGSVPIGSRQVELCQEPTFSTPLVDTCLSATGFIKPAIGAPNTKRILYDLTLLDFSQVFQSAYQSNESQ